MERKKNGKKGESLDGEGEQIRKRKKEKKRREQIGAGKKEREKKNEEEVREAKANREEEDGEWETIEGRRKNKREILLGQKLEETEEERGEF